MTILNFFDFNSAPLQEKPEAKDPIDAFAEAISRAGLGEVKPIPDGQLHRFATPGDKGKETSGWYVLYCDGVPAGVAGDWRSGTEITWSAKTDLTPQEQQEQDRRIEETKKLREAERQRVAQKAAEKAQRIWEEGRHPGAHPYLQKKGVSAYGIRQDKHGNLIIPAYDHQGTIHTLQFISPDGTKRFLSGGTKKGHFYTIPGHGERIYFAEGYATAATIHAATGATVVVAFDAGNLPPVCEAWAGKGRLFVCADNDEAGLKRAAETGQKVITPMGLTGTDFNDLAQEKGLDEVRRQLTGGSSYRINLHEWRIDRYEGPAPERKWLIQNTIPMGAVTILAAKGDTGKGMLMLDLALKVGGRAGGFLNPVTALGNTIESHGTAVILTAEDDEAEVHRRLERIGRKGDENVIVIPLPNAGGPAPLVVPGKNGPEATPFFYELREQLRQIPNLALINFDPLASFVMDDINADPAVGAYTMGLLASIGTETGAAVIVCHHLSKTAKTVRGHEDARNLVRGSTAIVDGARAVYVLWNVEDRQAKQVCNAMEIAWAPNMVYLGCVVKNNGPADRQIKTYVRNPDSGLLEVRDDSIRQVMGNHTDYLLSLLENDIAAAAEAGFPYTHTGASETSLYKNRARLHSLLQECGRQRIESLAQQLLYEGRVVKCRAKGSAQAKWLDVPDGKFARGLGEFPEGSDYQVSLPEKA